MVAKALDSPELSALIEELDPDPRRLGYPTRALLGPCLAKSLYGLETWADTARILGEHKGLSEALGSVPSRWAIYRFARKLHAATFRLANVLPG